MNALNADLLTKIIGALDYNTRVVLSLVNRRFRDLIKERGFCINKDISHELFLKLFGTCSQANNIFLYDIVESGNRENIGWILKNNSHLRIPYVFAHAAADYDLDVVKFFVENGAEYQEPQVLEAVVRSELDKRPVLDYLWRDLGCPVSPNLLLMAAAHGNYNNARWIVENGIMSINDSRIFSAAFCDDIDNIEKLIWLDMAGAPMSPLLYLYAGLHAKMEILDWLFAMDCPAPTELFLFLRVRFTPQVYEWFHQHEYLD